MSTSPPPWEGRIGGLSDQEIAEFLAAPWNGRLATITPEHVPHLTPVWYEYRPSDRAIDIVARERAAYVRHIQVNPHVAFHVADDVHLSHTRVLFQGIAEIREGPAAPARSPEMKEIVARMVVRYMGSLGAEYAARTDDRPRYLIRITPRTVTTWTGQEWHPRYRRRG
jgi:PPOX class probable F420-dependent enzyme